MNKDNARDYLPLVQALAEGKTIQHCKVSGEASTDYWQDCIAPTFRDKASRYRIKPEQKKMYFVRIAQVKPRLFWHSKVGVVKSNVEEQVLSEMPNFVRWLTDRIEYELPEGDA